MDQNEQTQSAFSPLNRRDAYLRARAETPEQKGLSYTDLLFDNIFGLDNEYESTGETIRKALVEDPYGTVGSMATSAYEGVVDFVRNPYEGVKGIVEDTAGSLNRVATEDLDEKLNRMYGVSYEEATPDQVTKAREVVASDVMTAAGVIPAVKAVGLAAKGGAALGKGATKLAKGVAKLDRDAINVSPEEALANIKSVNSSETLQFSPTGVYGETVHNTKKILESLEEKELLKLAQDLPHIADRSYGDFLKSTLNPLAKTLGVTEGDLFSLVKQISNFYPEKQNPRLVSVAEAQLPYKATLGPRAGSGKERPSDKKAEALGFKDTVYHSSTRDQEGFSGEFTEFDLGRTTGGIRSGQDLLGVHVGTARAAAERNYYAKGEDRGEPKGYTMELRARTDDPVTKGEIAKLFKKEPDELFDSPTGPFSESDLQVLLGQYNDLLYNSQDPDWVAAPHDIAREELTAIKMRKELAREGFTHIPYINDIEDPGSTSLIMLTDRPEGSPAVLRDSTAKFDPEKITSPDLRFAEGGIVEEEQMNRLMQEGGMADDGMSREPVTGNNIPPGALASEVRDDVDTKLSGGEYVVPADVLRYYGVRFFEDLRSQAKQGMMDMESEGRIGGVPVDPRGVPMQGQDEELTPEEEQMLAQAMSSTSGMAEGGTVFNRGDFEMTSNAITTRLYFNPTTGKKQTVTLMGGNIMGVVPDGFIPWTQSLQDTYDATKPATPSKPKKRSPYNDDDEPVATNSYDEWADENYEAITNDPFKFGMDLLKAPNDDGGVLGILTGKDRDILNVAGANAALKRLEAQGKVNSPEYVALAEEVKKYVGGLSLVERGLLASGVVGMGNQYDAALDRKAAENPPAATPPAAPVVNPPPAAPAASSTSTPLTPEEAARAAYNVPRPRTMGSQNSTGTDSVAGGANNNRISTGGGTNYNSPTPKPKPSLGGGVDGPKPTPKPATSTSSQGGSNTYSSSTYGSGSASYTPPKPVVPQGGRAGFEEGGLVTKPKKARAKTKGLAGKQ